MNLDTYQQEAVRTAKWFPSLLDNLDHAALGFITEIGEFATVVKRVSIYGKDMTQEMHEHALEEIGDTFWYCALACETMGLRMGAIIDKDGASEINDMKGGALALGLTSGTFAMGVYATRASGEYGKGIDALKAGLGLMIGMLDRTCFVLGVDAGEVLQRNIDKLRQRYPEKYSDAAAEARADKNGIDARNS